MYFSCCKHLVFVAPIPVCEDYMHAILCCKSLGVISCLDLFSNLSRKAAWMHFWVFQSSLGKMFISWERSSLSWTTRLFCSQPRLEIFRIKPRWSTRLHFRWARPCTRWATFPRRTKCISERDSMEWVLLGRKKGWFLRWLLIPPFFLFYSGQLLFLQWEEAIPMNHYLPPVTQNLVYFLSIQWSKRLFMWRLKQ